MTTTLYRRGRVRTPADPFATALMTDGDTVVWVGQEGAADALSPDVTVDLDDAWLAPAFVDAHVHATSKVVRDTPRRWKTTSAVSSMRLRVACASSLVRRTMGVLFPDAAGL